MLVARPKRLMQLDVGTVRQALDDAGLDAVLEHRPVTTLQADAPPVGDVVDDRGQHHAMSFIKNSPSADKKPPADASPTPGVVIVKPWFPKASVVGGIFASLFFVVMLSFMIDERRDGDRLGASRLIGHDACDLIA